jgi:hypothetical protein
MALIFMLSQTLISRYEWVSIIFIFLFFGYSTEHWKNCFQMKNMRCLR